VGSSAAAMTAGGEAEGLRRVHGDMVDNPLDENDAHMNVACDAGDEFGHEVVDGAVARSTAYRPASAEKWVCWPGT